MSPESSTLISLPPSSTTNKPRDRCDVIAELYAKGWRGEELEAEVRRREEEGRRRRGADTAEESKPATVLTISKAKVRDMERRIDQEAKDKKTLLLKAAMERWKTLKANSKTNAKKNPRRPASSIITNSSLPTPVVGITNEGLPEDSMQEGSKWDQACRRWEDRGGPLNFGSTVYHIARPSEGEAQHTVGRTLDPELHGYGGGTTGEGITATGLGTQPSHHGPGVQWNNTEDDGHSTAFAPIDIGVPYTFSPEYVRHPIAKSWNGNKESLRQALISALIDLDAESEDLSPEQMMLMTPSQSSDYFGHSSQSIPPSDSSMTMAAEFGGHELGLGLVYAAQSPAESSF
ncbi:hypothetical protein FRC00_009528, partial [Tulasnella sp. 408]